MEREILMPCIAKDLKKGMIIKRNSYYTTLNVEYSRSASYDLTWVKFKEIDEEILHRAFERFEVIVDEEYIDKNRDEFGHVPMWCINSLGKIKYNWIDRYKK